MTGMSLAARTDVQLAQVNIARLAAPLDSAQLADFVAGLEPVNALAEAADGYVWRLKDESGDATAIEAFAWDAGDSLGVIVNMSVWRDLESLVAFVYDEGHRAVLRRRREWFRPVTEVTTACWWVPAGHEPSTDEAEDRVRHLRAHGPTPYAFTLRTPFQPEDVDPDYQPETVLPMQAGEPEAAATLC
jgi:hypothetical protein